MKAVVIEELGGPDKMKFKEVPIPEPGRGEVLVKNTICGVNYLDSYLRSGDFPSLTLPAILGVEAAGTIHKLGPEVSEAEVGQHVAYLQPSLHGAFAEYTTVPAARLVNVPDGISSEQAATAILQGMTAHYLVHSTYQVKVGDKVLVHAAAGGTGSLVCQAAKNAGAFVIGTTSTDEKAAIAKAAGADEVILYTKKDFVKEVNRITNNQGVNVIYDGVGKATFAKGFGCLSSRGCMAMFGGASGYPDNLDMSLLQDSKSVVTPVLFNYIVTTDELRERSATVFKWIKEGKMKFKEFTVLPLSEARKAYEMLEGRKTVGKLLLKP